MRHPKHITTAKRKQGKATIAKKMPTKSLPIGVASAKKIRDARKSAVIVSVAERPWVIKLTAGEEIRMPITVTGAGFLIAKVTGACYHISLDEIPTCTLVHHAHQIDPDADWNTILAKAAWGSNVATPAETMAQRKKEGWFVIDFTVAPDGFPKEWRARAAKRRAATG